VFRYITDEQRPVDVAELTEHLGLHHNAIRQHLAKLTEAGLISEGTAPRVGRGRPRLVYTVDPSADSRWGATGPYERLSLMLTEIIRSGDSPVDVGRRFGARADVAASHGADPVSDLVDAMERQGFAPVATRRRDQVDIVLRACPFETTALADPDTVCGLHLGMALGVAETLDGVVVDELLPRDPRRGSCRLRCHVAS
jgi:predicted ArsR family transcriptional regulator